MMSKRFFIDLVPIAFSLRFPLLFLLATQLLHDTSSEIPLILDEIQNGESLYDLRCACVIPRARNTLERLKAD